MNSMPDWQAVNRREHMAVEATILASSLHIDPTDSELAVLTSLIGTAQALVKSSVSTTMSDDEYAQQPLYDSCVTALATALYYDRTLSSGIPKAVTIMITHLQGAVGGV